MYTGGNSAAFAVERGQHQKTPSWRWRGLAEGRALGCFCVRLLVLAVCSGWLATSCARKTHLLTSRARPLSCYEEAVSKTSLARAKVNLRARESLAHIATHLRPQACCYIRMAPSPSKFDHHGSRKVYYLLAPPLNFALLPPLNSTVKVAHKKVC